MKWYLYMAKNFWECQIHICTQAPGVFDYQFFLSQTLVQSISPIHNFAANDCIQQIEIINTFTAFYEWLLPICNSLTYMKRLNFLLKQIH